MPYHRNLSVPSSGRPKPLRIALLLRQAARHPRAATWGAREFRSDLTRHYDDWDQAIAYDSGRELAHITTMRRWDW